MNKLERIEALEAEIKKLKQELSEPEFEVGKWYKNKSKEYNFLFCYQGNQSYGWGNNYNWHNDLVTNKESLHLYRPATESEVFEALKKEAIKRGFKEGVTIDVFYGHYEKCKLSHRLNNFSDWGYDKSNNLLGIIGGHSEGFHVIIFKDGKWAEIIDEPFKVCGYEVKKANNYINTLYKIGCKNVDTNTLEQIRAFMINQKFKTVQFDEYKVTLEEINKILEL